jgi:hypothetical protein
MGIRQRKSSGRESWPFSSSTTVGAVRKSKAGSLPLVLENPYTAEGLQPSHQSHKSFGFN